MEHPSGRVVEVGHDPSLRRATLDTWLQP